MGWSIRNSELLQGLLDLLFPALCLGCGAFTEDSDHLCDVCRAQFENYDLPFCLNCSRQIPKDIQCSNCGVASIPLFAYGNYTPPLKDVIIHFKFKGITSPAGVFARLLVDQFGDKIASLECDQFIPIPLHPSRENTRGYNQAGLFADRLAELLGGEVRNDILSRVKKRKEQARLDHRHRASNIRGVFEIDRISPDGCRVMLVDDVVTSGLTVKEACRVLEEGGYKVVAVLSIAHHI